ncbi:helix-turn-helix domain-containing protein [Streptomyces albus subsp. chlorinus]|uniref:helix-turn-helix domain-containing protein n=1 Tax=Streptomyces albus TaxID=1888 RepID=UPI00156E3D0C|nr:helix-turn-helix transcriptional regulator [Streptomyces albus]NSC21632.1 helix-turn-helix domain-containing protein [Streptomyces albus subsp. chlorinus]
MPSDRKPTMRGRRLGSALRQYRLAAKLDQEHAAEALGCSTAKISRIESGANCARVAEVRYLLDLYEVKDRTTRSQLERLARSATKRGWWVNQPVPVPDKLGDYLALESDVTFIRTWQTALVPGLLQTAEYTRALTTANPAIEDEAEVDLVVSVRQERRKQFLASGARLAAVIWEPALTSSMSSPKTHRAQLLDLLWLQQQPLITLQVLPLNEWAAATNAPPFVMLSYDGEWAPSAVVQDTHQESVVLEDDHLTALYGHTFDTLRSAALTPEQSRDFIQKLITTIPQEGEPT